MVECLRDIDGPEFGNHPAARRQIDPIHRSDLDTFCRRQRVRRVLLGDEGHNLFEVSAGGFRPQDFAVSHPKPPIRP